jgi:hypothetical protein
MRSFVALFLQNSTRNVCETEYTTLDQQSQDSIQQLLHAATESTIKNHNSTQERAIFGMDPDTFVTGFVDHLEDPKSHVMYQ